VQINKKQTQFYMGIIVFFTTLILYGISYVYMLTQTFFSPDNALRFLQIQSLVAKQWSTFALDYPAEFLDPDFFFTPYFRSYSIINQQLYFNVSPYFTILSSWFYALLGVWGLPAVPVIGCVLTALATYKLACLTKLLYVHIAFWGTIITTPLLFYSLELWDHTITTALALWGIYGIANGLAQNKWQFVSFGGIALGIGTAQRPEIYPFSLAVGLSLLWVSRLEWRHIGALVIGGILGVIPTMMLQYLWFGHPLAPVTAHIVFGYGRLEDYLALKRSNPKLLEKIWLLANMVPSQYSTILGALMIVMGWVPFVLAPRHPFWRVPTILWGGFGLTVLGYLPFFIIAWREVVFGLITSYPLMGLSLMYIKPEANNNLKYHAIYQLIMSTAILFVGFMVLLWPAYGGLQWGSRYLLPVYPLLFYLALYGYQGGVTRFVGSTRLAFQRVAIGLLVVSILFQLWGIRLNWWWHQHQQVLLNEANTLPVNFIITNQQDLSAILATAPGKSFLFIGNQGEYLETILQRLGDHDIRYVGIWSHRNRPLDVPATIGDYSLIKISSKVYKLEMQ